MEKENYKVSFNEMEVEVLEHCLNAYYDCLIEIFCDYNDAVRNNPDCEIFHEELEKVKLKLKIVDTVSKKIKDIKLEV